MGYSFYFVLGYYLDNFELRKKYRILIYFLGVLGFAFTSSRSRCELVQTLIFLNLKLFFRTEFYSA